MWAGRAESGQLAWHWGGRWSLQVPSKCFEYNATGHQNPSKVTESLLNLASHNFSPQIPQYEVKNQLKFFYTNLFELKFSDISTKSDLILMNSDHIVC